MNYWGACQAVDGLLLVLGASGSEQIGTPSWYVSLNLERLDDVQSYEKPGKITLRQALTEFCDIKTPKPTLYSMLWDAVDGDIRDQAQPLIEQSELTEKESKKASQEKKQDLTPSLMQVGLGRVQMLSNSQQMVLKAPIFGTPKH